MTTDVSAVRILINACCCYISVAHSLSSRSNSSSSSSANKQQFTINHLTVRFVCQLLPISFVRFFSISLSPVRSSCYCHHYYGHLAMVFLCIMWTCALLNEILSRDINPILVSQSINIQHSANDIGVTRRFRCASIFASAYVCEQMSVRAHIVKTKLIKTVHFIYISQQQHTFYFNRTLLSWKPLITLKRNGCLALFFLSFLLWLFALLRFNDTVLCSKRISFNADKREIWRQTDCGIKKTEAHIHHIQCGLARLRSDGIRRQGTTILF